jgi:hypothetical protein
MTAARKASYILLSCVFAFILAYLIPERIDRREFTQAVITYSRNPTPENAAALEAQRRANDRIHLEDSAAIGLVLILVAYGIWGLRKLAMRLASRTGSSRMGD